MLTPDGVRYLASTQQRVARPFHLRWLQPAVCGRSPRRWQFVTRGAIVAVGILTALYAGSPWMACVALLPGLTFSWRHPVLVDPLGMALALAAAIMLPYCWPAAVALVLVAGCVRETAPVWAAVYAWHPLLLVGLVPVAFRWLQKPGPDVLDDENRWILDHPIQAGRKFHAGQWLNPELMLTPWGGLVAVLGCLTPQAALALVLGYGQLLIATDSVRLYQWAAPVVALAVVQGLPAWALPIVATTVAFNPWKGPGV